MGKVLKKLESDSEEFDPEDEKIQEQYGPFTKAVVASWNKQGITSQKIKQVQKIIEAKHDSEWTTKAWHEAVAQVAFEDVDSLMPILITNLCHMAFNPYASEAARIKASEMLMTHIKETAGPEPPNKITKSNILEISEKALHSIIIGKGLRSRN